MEQLLQESLTQFTKTHDEFIQNWEQAMQTADTSKLEVMASGYYVTSFNGFSDKPEFYDCKEAIMGMRESVKELKGANKRFENRVIRQRGQDAYVVFYEMVIEKDQQEIARFFTIEDWKQINGTWQLVREISEHI